MEHAIEYHNKKRAFKTSIEDILREMDQWMSIRQAIKEMKDTWEVFLVLIHKQAKDIRNVLLHMWRRPRDRWRWEYKKRDSTDIKADKNRFTAEELKKNSVCCQCGKVSKILIGWYCPDCL